MQLGSVSSEISLKTLQVFAFKHHIMGKIKVFFACMSVFKGRKFKINNIITYFDTFKLKTHSKI